MASLNGCLVEECTPCFVAAQQLYERIVEWQENLVTSRGKIGSLSCFHERRFALFGDTL
jgi:hypothetical protein